MQLAPLRVSKAIRDTLLACAVPGDDSRSLSAVTDWSALLNAAHVHGMVPLVSERLRRSGYPDDTKRVLLANQLMYARRSTQLEEYLGRVLSALTEVGVASIVLKGPALANSVYPQSSLRPYGDIDILCREKDWVAVHEVLIGQGYVPVNGLTAPPPKVWDRKAYYHTQYWRPTEGVLVEVHFDLWQVGLRPRLGERFWQQAVPVSIAGTQGQMLAPEDQVLHLCVHLHHHGYKRLIWFTDLALLLRLPQPLDWDYIVWAAGQEGVGPSVYYALRYLTQLLGADVPVAVLRALHPNSVQAALHDHLWPAGPILELEIDQTVSCGEFHEVPEVTELLSNLVLSGRRWEKVLYVGRLLLPSTAWLAYYYGTADPGTLRLRRLMHAPKLLGGACRQLFAAARRAVRGERWVPEHAIVAA